jgi:hypothetical protein
VSSFGCAAKGRETLVGRIVHQWDSAARSTALHSSSQPTARSEEARADILHEFTRLDHSDTYGRMMAYLEKTVDSAAFIVRVTNRRVLADTLPEDFLGNYDLPWQDTTRPAASVRWIIGTGTGHVRVVSVDDGGQDIVETSFDCAPPLEALRQLDIQAYTVGLYPPTQSVVSIWTPGLVENLSVNGLFSKGSKGAIGNFLDEEPPALRWIAQVAESRRCP